MSSLKTSAVEMVQSLKKGEITSEELVKSYIEQIKKKEKDVEAWEFFDPELAIAQAKNRMNYINQVNTEISMAYLLVLKIFLIQKICQLQMVQKFIRKI